MSKRNKNLKSTVKKTGAVIAISTSVTIAAVGFGGVTAFADTLHHVPQNGPIAVLVKPAVNSNYTNVQYQYTMAKYAAEEMKEFVAGGGVNNKAHLDEILNAINPNCASSVFEFLKVNTFRNVNVKATEEFLNGKGVLSGEAQNFIDSAKSYNIDPVYFIAQSILETGWGESEFANGVTIHEIAVPIEHKDAKTGKEVITGYKLQKLNKPTTVYNLYGIGAYNSLASFPNRTTIMATTYAYNHGWTSVPKAIDGAAQFLAGHYVHNTYLPQNTPYELRFIDAPSEDMWHQYSTDIAYASKISNIMNQMKNLYSPNDSFEFAIPKFEGETPTVVPNKVVKPETKPEVVPNKVVKPEVVPNKVVKPETKPEVEPNKVVKPEIKPEVVPNKAVKPEIQPVVIPNKVVKTKVQSEVEPNKVIKSEIKPEVEPNKVVKPETKPEVVPNKVVKPEIKPEVEPNKVVKPETKPEVEPNKVIKSEIQPVKIINPVTVPSNNTGITPINSTTPVANGVENAKVLNTNSNIKENTVASSNPKTGDTSEMPYVLGLAAAGILLLVTQMKRIKVALKGK